MSNKTDITIKDCMVGAFQALLNGDTDERDRLCNLAEIGFNGRETVNGEESIFKTEKES